MLPGANMSNEFRSTSSILAVAGMLALLLVGVLYVFSSDFYETPPTPEAATPGEVDGGPP